MSNKENKPKVYMKSTGAILDSVGLGNPAQSMTNHMFGVNHSGYTVPPPKNHNKQGYLFFTRPQLNMTTENIVRNRKMSMLLTKQEKSIGRWIRNTLDPRLAVKTSNATDMAKYFDDTDEILKCPLVDEKYAFIPLLTNSLVTASGWPDKVSGIYTSEPNVYKDVYMQVDSLPNTREPLQLDLTFHNSINDPIFHLFDIWDDYGMHTFAGSMKPYYDHIIQTEKDNETRVFRIVLDASGRYLTRIAATRPGLIAGMSHGSFYDYDANATFIPGTETISARLSFPSAEYNDPILIKEFNITVGMFNPEILSDVLRQTKYRLAPLGHGFVNNNFKAYPRINPDTLEFEWWIPKYHDERYEPYAGESSYSAANLS
jgi:hypothetical protein